MIEGSVLMFVCSQCCLTDPRQQIKKADALCDIHTQHQVVDEEANQIAQFSAAAIGRRRSNHHIPLPAVSREQ